MSDCSRLNSWTGTIAPRSTLTLLRTGLRGQVIGSDCGPRTFHSSKTSISSLRCHTSAAIVAQTPAMASQTRQRRRVERKKSLKPKLKLPRNEARKMWLGFLKTAKTVVKIWRSSKGKSSFCSSRQRSSLRRKAHHRHQAFETDNSEKPFTQEDG